MDDNDNNFLNNGDDADPQQDELFNQLMERELELRNQDVWLGGGQGPRKHPGTVFKRDLIIENYPHYEAKSIPRKQLYEEVYDAIQARGGRFMKMKKVDGSCWFEEVPKVVAIERIAGNFNQYQTQLKNQATNPGLPANVAQNEDVLPPPQQQGIVDYEPLPLQANVLVRDEPSWLVQIERMERERMEALNANQTLHKRIAELEAARDQALVQADQFRGQADQLRTELAESKAQTSIALSEVDQLRKEPDAKPESLSVDGVQVLVDCFMNAGDDSSDLASVFDILSLEDSNNSKEQPRRKVCKTVASGSSGPKVRCVPGKYDARTVISGLSDWKRTFVDQAQNLKEMMIVEKLTVGHGSYRGSILRGKPHGLGLMRMKGRIILATWNNGVATGLACVWYKDGDTYFGRLERNERHGEGIYQSKKDCFEYVGTFQHDNRDGKGVFKFTKGHEMCGHEYEGNFAKGVFEGKGTHWFPNGEEESGQFANWKLEEADPKVLEEKAGRD